MHGMYSRSSAPARRSRHLTPPRVHRPRHLAWGRHAFEPRMRAATLGSRQAHSQERSGRPTSSSPTPLDLPRAHWSERACSWQLARRRHGRRPVSLGTRDRLEPVQHSRDLLLKSMEALLLPRLECLQPLAHRRHRCCCRILLFIFLISLAYDSSRSLSLLVLQLELLRAGYVEGEALSYRFPGC